MMLDGPGLPGGFPLPPKEEEEEEALASNGSISIEAGGEGWGSTIAGEPYAKGSCQKGPRCSIPSSRDRPEYKEAQA